MRSRRGLAALLALAILVSGACGSGQVPLTVAPELGPPTLAPGDSIRIDVWRYAEFSGQFGIDSEGRIAHPLYRDVRATEVPLDGLDDSIRELLRAYIDEPVLVVEPLFVVVVVGNVEMPGTYAMAPATTLVQAVARAGGPAPEPKLSATKLLRSDSDGSVREYALDLSDPLDIAFQATVRSGDQIVVPRKTFTTGLWIALIGAVAAVLLVVERFSD